ncbi:MULTISPECIES: CidA/LrgA family holin-like protein [Bacillaceae]|uniref:CidA/LrgA family protein n=1 Tax=Bacillaceae TaxID=186817 RepID=UPI0021109B7F|nr:MULTISPECIES: CidA/LrgA family holin-like protein [Bacillaceae]MDF2065647.1 CidA/LrgA family holin-like protein [Bacillus sp. Cr_A10]
MIYIFKYLRVVFQILILYMFSFLGTVIVQSLHIKFPGSIIGLILLFAGLYFKLIPISLIKDGAGFLLSVLTLFFVPATVGVMNYPELLSFQGLLLILSVIISTIITIIISGRVGQYLETKQAVKEEE